MSENHDWIVLSKAPLLKLLTRSVITLMTVVGIIGVGLYLQSEAMQWAGFVLLIFIAIGNGINPPKNKTPQQAADYLLKEYGVTAEQEKGREA